MSAIEMPSSTAAPGPAAPAGGGGGASRAGGRLIVLGARRCTHPAREVLTRHTGQRTSFTGRLVPNPPGFAQRVGMVPEEGATLAGRQGHHIEVDYADITLEP